MKRLIAIAACIAVLSTATLRAAEPVDMQKRAAELKSLHWGMFVCWSFSTFSGKEWTPGVKDISIFKATGCDTDQWARTAKEAGMGYILFLTKHHDGFCLWDTKTTDRKVTRSAAGPRRAGRAAQVVRQVRHQAGPLFLAGRVRATTRTIIRAATRPRCRRPNSRNSARSTGRSSSSGWTAPRATAGMDRKEITAWVKQFQPGCFVGFNGGGAGDLRAGEMEHPGPVKRLTWSANSPIRSCRRTRAGRSGSTRCPSTTTSACRPRRSIASTAARSSTATSSRWTSVPTTQASSARSTCETLRKVGEMIEHAAPPEPTAAFRRQAGQGFEHLGPRLRGRQGGGRRRCDPLGRGAGARSGWLEIDLGKPMTVGRAVVKELGYPPHAAVRHRVQGRRDVEAAASPARRSAASGAMTFPPVKAPLLSLEHPQGQRSADDRGVPVVSAGRKVI